MKTITKGNLVIEREMTDNRFYDLVRGYRVNKEGDPVAFLGKYKVASIFSNEEIIKLYEEGKI